MKRRVIHQSACWKQPHASHRGEVSCFLSKLYSFILIRGIIIRMHFRQWIFNNADIDRQNIFVPKQIAFDILEKKILRIFFQILIYKGISINKFCLHYIIYFFSCGMMFKDIRRFLKLYILILSFVLKYLFWCNSFKYAYFYMLYLYHQKKSYTFLMLFISTL